MVDPLAEIVMLLQPQAPYSKMVAAAGAWWVRREKFSEPFYCATLEGQCVLDIDGQKPIHLQAGDFALVPSPYGFTMSSVGLKAADAVSTPIQLPDGSFRVGEQNGPADVLQLVGHCHFGSPDKALLLSFLPQVIHVRTELRLAVLMQLVSEETRAQRPARDVILARLLEVLLIEALRSNTHTDASTGILRGLADNRLALALRSMHAQVTRPWTVAELAKEAALSRSAFFERFSHAVGVAPMKYLLSWRWLKICCATVTTALPQYRNRLAMVLPVPSASLSLAMLVCRQQNMPTIFKSFCYR